MNLYMRWTSDGHLTVVCHNAGQIAYDGPHGNNHSYDRGQFIIMVIMVVYLTVQMLSAARSASPEP